MNADKFQDKKSVPGEPQRHRQLDRYYEQVQLIILLRQDPVTGLLPDSSGVSVHDHHANTWIRDNIYGILAAWGLAVAYRRYERDKGRRCLLEQSVVKLMRGLLLTMMRQASKAECFGPVRNPRRVLPVQYDRLNDNPAPGDDPWGPLQPETTALFLLMLVQMIASGLRIVLTLDEVDFIQNLAHYLGRVYYTPDYGLWEQAYGNEETPEIHAGSLGMVKAALEVLQGFDLFGAQGGPASVIHVVADDIAHIRAMLEALLPRESGSRETDAALLTVIGFPAFAMENARLVERTRHEIIGRLQGRYGCKRFPRDGRLPVLKTQTRLHSPSSRFPPGEAEWPLFFTYLLLDGTFRGDWKQAREYRERLESLLVERHDQRWLPEFYSVPEERRFLERVRPHSQKQLPDGTVPLVWAQSLYLLGVLLQEGFIQAHELDPLGRRSRIGRQRDTWVLIALLAENEAVRITLQNQGIDAQTPDQVAPVGIYPACAWEDILGTAGHNRTAGLPGRLGSLTTAQAVILAGGKTAVFTPSFLDPGGFYLTLDNHLLAERIQTELRYLNRHWDQPGQPLMVLPIGAAMLQAADQEVLLELLRSLRNDRCCGVRVRTARLAELLPAAGWKRMDALDLPVQPAAGYLSDPATAAGQGLSAARPLPTAEVIGWRREPDDRQLLQRLLDSRNPYEQIELLILLWERLGPEFRIEEQGRSLRQELEAVYLRAGRARLWDVVRRAAGRLERVDMTLQDAVATIVMSRHGISVGRAYSQQAIITRPMSNAEIMERIRAYGGDDVRVRVLIQEIVLLLGMLLRGAPELCRGTRTLRPWRWLLMMTASLAREQGMTQWEAMEVLLEYSPSALLTRLQRVISDPGEARRSLSEAERLGYRGEIRRLQRVDYATERELTLVGEDVWSTWRELNGVEARLPEDFHARAGEVLDHCRGVVIGDRLNGRNRLDGFPGRTDRGAEDAMLRVKPLLNDIHPPKYRQLNIEALMVLADVFRVNPELYIEDELVLDVLIGTAVYHNWREQLGSVTEQEYYEHCAEAWNAFYACSPYRVAGAITVALSALLRPAERRVEAVTRTTVSSRRPCL